MNVIAILVGQIDSVIFAVDDPLSVGMPNCVVSRNISDPFGCATLHRPDPKGHLGTSVLEGRYKEFRVIW
jgi:hypothetical protein